MSAAPLPYYHADVFAPAPLSGNGLAVFSPPAPLTGELMQRVTREMRQFESNFLEPVELSDVFAARVFTVEEELPFAGHPALGAGAVFHASQHPSAREASFRLRFSAGEVVLESERTGPRSYAVAMDQGLAEFGVRLAAKREAPFLAALGLTASGLAKAGIRTRDFGELLGTVGAKFAYVLDPERPGGRTWDNLGAVEDVATGSAAGPAAAYLVREGVSAAGEAFVMAQGRFTGRARRSLRKSLGYRGNRRSAPPVGRARGGALDRGSCPSPYPVPRGLACALAAVGQKVTAAAPSPRSRIRRSSFGSVPPGPPLGSEAPPS